MTRLPAVSILGIGAVTPVGRKLEVIEEAVKHSRAEMLTTHPATPPDCAATSSTHRATPSDIAATSSTHRATPSDSASKSSPHPPSDAKLPTPVSTAASKNPVAYPGMASAPPPVDAGWAALAPRRVDDATLALDPSVSAQMRRADRFTRMAVAAASDAFNSAKAACVGIPSERIGLMVSSGFGPHCRGFRFLDGILDSGDTASSPTDFSHSVHGSAAAYISRLLDLRDPSLNSTDFEIGFEETVRLAQCWLADGSCDRMLIGAVEELGEVFLACAGRMLPRNADGSTDVHPGEGAVFLMLGPDDQPGMATLSAGAEVSEADLLIRVAPELESNDSNAPPIRTPRSRSFAAVFGTSASSSAFGLLGALLSMRGDESIDTAATLRTSSEGRSVTLRLEK